MTDRPILKEIIPVILAGGEGRRLRPLSTPRKPKPFLRIFSHRSLLQKTAERCRLMGLGDPVIVCNAAHRGLVVADLQQCGMAAQQVFLEPCGRGTAPAIAAAAHYFFKDDPLLLVMPSDHAIRYPESLAQAVAAAAPAARNGRLVTFGLTPQRPETGFGYIRQGKMQGALYDVASFTEKPDKATAKKFMTEGGYLWNSGLFLFSAKTYLAQLQKFAPEIHAACLQAVGRAVRMRESVVLNEEAFNACPSGSADRVIMEKTRDLAVVPVDMGWRDVGTWQSLLQNIFIK